ncbi:neuropeptide Y receptor type 2-like [Macrosteles quadrilineatus]|uniref:neuropeptide Y receptor type 2-like n=1 Tax=Macrosteles quadrilineatus TaxID=74068 RepID=UPI0023E1AAC9|nr:neuropeptide Y receptor type 2-like [Macrosteles quadrilineatus]
MAETPWNSSYLLGEDGVQGWGTRYFFTFYSEFGPRGSVATVEVFALAVMFVPSVVANLGIASAVLRYREMRTVTNCFLLNLSVADCLFAAGIPAVALARVSPHWRLGDLVCRLLPYSQFVCGFVLLWTLTLISMDRHRCIVVPPYRSRLTPRLATLLTAGVWALAAVLFLPVAFWFHHDDSLHICTLVFPRSDFINLSICFTIPVIFFACILPMSLLVYHYQRIFHKLLKTRNRWATTSNLSPADSRVDMSRKISLQHIVYPVSRLPSLSHHEELRLSKHIRVVRVLLLNVLVVVIMWLPITVVMFLIYVDGRRPTEDTDFFLRSHHFVWALMIAYLNTVVNPILYGLLSENFRACFSRLWFMSKRRKRACKTLAQENSRVQRTPSCGKSLDLSQTSDKRPRPCYQQGSDTVDDPRHLPTTDLATPSAAPSATPSTAPSAPTGEVLIT